MQTGLRLPRLRAATRRNLRRSGSATDRSGVSRARRRNRRSRRRGQETDIRPTTGPPPISPAKIPARAPSFCRRQSIDVSSLRTTDGESEQPVARSRRRDDIQCYLRHCPVALSKCPPACVTRAQNKFAAIGKFVKGPDQRRRATCEDVESAER